MDDNEGSVAIGFLLAFFLPCFIGFFVAFFALGQPKTKQGAIYGIVTYIGLMVVAVCLVGGLQVALQLM